MELSLLDLGVAGFKTSANTGPYESVVLFFLPIDFFY